MADGAADTRPRGLGPCDVLTVEEAARALRMREADARAWLRAKGFIREIGGRERVPWGEVYRAIAGGETTAEPEPPAPKGRAGGGRLPRVSL